MSEHGPAISQENDPLPERRQSLINEIYQALPAAERFQREWARRVRAIADMREWYNHDLDKRTYAKYPHNFHQQIRAKYSDATIELWPIGLWVLPRGESEQHAAAGMVHGHMRLLVADSKEGPYRDMTLDYMHDLFPVNLNAIRCLLAELAKLPKVTAGEPSWPAEVRGINE